MNNEHKFEIVSPFKPTGDQPTAIRDLVKGINEGKKFQGMAGSLSYNRPG